MGDVLTGAGLIVGTLGTVCVFVWGFPQPEFRGDALLLESSPSEAELAAKRAHHRRRSFVGIGLIGFGFLLQFVGLIVGG